MQHATGRMQRVHARPRSILNGTLNGGRGRACPQAHLQRRQLPQRQLIVQAEVAQGAQRADTMQQRRAGCGARKHLVRGQRKRRQAFVACKGREEVLPLQAATHAGGQKGIKRTALPKSSKPTTKPPDTTMLYSAQRHWACHAAMPSCLPRRAMQPSCLPTCMALPCRPRLKARPLT